MVLFILGTTGELIKVMPVMKEFHERNLACRVLCTGQQATQIGGMLRRFGLPEPDLWLARGFRGKDLARNTDVLPWLAQIGLRLVRNYSRLRGMGVTMVLVHGDTMTTLLGAMIGRLLGVRVGHIEAGLRSHNLLNPFPEEMNRVLTSRLVHYHFAPGAWAAGNLRNRKGRIVDTRYNTLLDAVLRAGDAAPGEPIPELPHPFGLVSIHRFELINDRNRLRVLLEALSDIAQDSMPLVFIDHPVTRAKLEQHGLRGFYAQPRVRAIPRLDFYSFIGLLRRCAFIVTDSGGNQEECYYLGKPCIVHRAVTERKEGLGQNCQLTGLDVERLRHWVNRRADLERPPKTRAISPSSVIVDAIVRAHLA